MIVLKRWIRGFLSFFVFLRFKNVFDLFDYLQKNNIKSGVLASCFSHYCDVRASFIGLNAKFENHPYFPHGLSGVFISENAKIGKNAVIFQQVTIGSSCIIGSDNNGSPTIGDNCYIGAGAKIIGNINIGNNVRIGANCVVYEDVPDNCVVVAAKTRIIRREETLDNRFVKIVDGQMFYYDFDTSSFKKL